VSATGISLDVARELRSICGDENTRERPIGGVYVSPASPEEVAAVLGLANEHRLSVGPAGGSTEFNAAELRADIVLHTNRLTQVEHYDHADLTVGVGAGTTVAQLNAMVNAANLMFAADPPLPERCTVGGLLATAGHGPLRHGFGAVRDYCIGVRFVTGDGRRAKGGGRVVKNVAGYDLMKLLIGSYGSLAVITSASFKLFPAPRQTRTFLAEFASAKEALEFRDRVGRSPLSPMCLELVSPGARRMMRPELLEDAWVMCLRAAGSDAVLARYRKELGMAITREVERDGERMMWKVLADFPQAMPGATGTSPVVTIHATTPPTQTLMVLEFLEASASSFDLEIGMIGRVGVGHVLAALSRPGDDRPPAMDGLVNALCTRFPETCIKVAGAPNPWPVRPANLAQMQAVKRALDPAHILRGREIA
jgi:glycolate dehydrogenase FAD-binding subunit